MKADADSIVVIVLTLLFLVITGLSKRRKRKPGMKSNLQYGKSAGQDFKGKDLLSDAVTMINDPFAKLEQIFNVPEQSAGQEVQSLEEMPVMEQVSSEPTTPSKAISPEVNVAKEPPLEVIVDEVSEYLKQKEIGKISTITDKKFDDQDLTKQVKPDYSILDQKKRSTIPLFENVDDLKKAIIYAEILGRKDF